MNFGTFYAAVRDEGGFDTTSTGTSLTSVKRWCNSAYDAAVARSHWRRSSAYSLGTTVANQAEYTLADEVVDVEQLYVGGTPYSLASARELGEIKYGSGTYSRGIFAPDWSATGTAQIELYPAPDTSGSAITGLVALRPAALSADADTLITPTDFDEHLISAAIALGKERIEEGDLGIYEQRIDDLVTRLKRRMTSRVGSGPQRSPVYLRDFP